MRKTLKKRIYDKEISQNEDEEEERSATACVHEGEKEEEEGLFTQRLCVDLAYTHIHAQCRQQILITPY